MERVSEHRHPGFRDAVGFAVVGVTLLAPALGGSTQLWAKAIIAAITGAIFVLAPPSRSLGRWFNAVFLLTAASALIAFLPAEVFPTPPWRIPISNLGVHLPATRSPQPWLSLESGLLLWLGLAWTYYLFSYRWDARLRETAWDVFCFGILALAATLTICFAFGLRIPFWPAVKEFGFFPNRNQTSDVLGLGGIMIYANAFHHLQRGQKRGWMWLASLGVVCWALILNYSRAGIILFFVGVLIWHVWWLRRSSKGASKFVAWTPLAILVGLLLIAGGETLVRFQHSTDFLMGATNGRALIQRDALALLKTAPVLGIGLGNFRSLFTTHRRFYVSTAEAIHPESDWLWMAVELGCVAVIVLLIGIALWARCCFPLRAGTWRGMRVAALICGIGFLIHGIFDVSGHRVGSLWPALFLASTAIDPERTYPASRLVRIAFLFLGFVFVGVAAWWGISSVGFKAPPTSAKLDRLMEKTATETTAGNYADVLRLTSEGLEIAPLKWILYYNRGVAEAALGKSSAKVERDFAIARYLLPNWPALYLNEGVVWLGSDEPDRAFAVWKEGIRRLDNGPALFADVYDAIKDEPDLRDRWRHLASDSKECLLVFLQNAEPVEFQIELGQLLHDDPELGQLGPADLEKFFAIWYRKGDKLSLARALQENSDWRKAGWRQLARALADYQDYRQAYETAVKFVPAPQLPVVSSTASVESMAMRFRVSRNHQGDGLALAIAEARRGQTDDALATLAVLASEPKPAPAVYFLQAEYWSRKANWQKAWEAMAKYLGD